MRFRGVRAGVVYGLFVCAGLLITLVLAPYGETMLFPLNPATVVMAVGGHVIYGAMLGRLSDQRSQPCRNGRSGRGMPVRATLGP